MIKTPTAQEPGLLDELHALTDAFDLDERRAFASYFIGALSNLVPAEDWRRALTTATACVQADRVRKATKTAPNTH